MDGVDSRRRPLAATGLNGLSGGYRLAMIPGCRYGSHTCSYSIAGGVLRATAKTTAKCSFSVVVSQSNRYNCQGKFTHLPHKGCAVHQELSSKSVLERLIRIDPDTSIVLVSIGVHHEGRLPRSAHISLWRIHD